jgi:hypothetical protein
VAAQPGPGLRGELHPLPVLVAGVIGVAELDPPRFVGTALGSGDVGLEFHRIGTRVGDRVDESVRHAQAAVVCLTYLTYHHDTVIPIEYSHATHSSVRTNG